MKKSIVYSFGRFSPIHKGHEKVVKAVVALAQKVNGDHLIFASKTQDTKRNPLSPEQKVAYLRHSFRGVNFVASSAAIPTFIEAAKSFSGKYENLYMVAGSDRIVEFKTTLDKYNGDLYQFKSIVVVSSGDRDPDAEGTTGLSATKMRQAAIDNNFNLFKSGVPASMSVSMAKKMFDDVRLGLKVTEETNTIRDRYIKEEIYQVGDIVLYEGKEMTIKYRGSNHVILESDGQTKRAWLYTIEASGKVNESMKFKQEDKIKVARIIGMALGYDEAETKTNPTNIINTALRLSKNKPLNPEAKKILVRMLQSARDAEIPFDEKLVPVLKENVLAELRRTKDRVDDTTDDEGEAVKDTEKEDANLYLDDKGKSEYERRRKIQFKVHEETDEEDHDLDDKDLDSLEDELTDDDVIEYAYEDDEFEVVDEEGEEDIKEDYDYTELTEVLSRAERMRARVRFAHTKAKRTRALKISLKKRSSSDVLARRARRAAVKALEKRLAKKPLNTLSVSEKERIEARVARMKKTVSRLAVRMLPKIRKIEKDRLSTARTQ